ncbi:efflux RND transporter periplasmic adaptor subunit [Psychromonas sp. Urea-02u-13]|uniref:efflux RND transporter periplasmic adaptor subunit n=1 Tax=Psychromonas sp. Urea-02u-13 TaxID=2058326 RepID=UPI000C33A83D|nr:efflux RND transporter periplasmic adaptor subunit [Psychromonas sp. Urea-02u-13]PKG38575.1 efflux RND transporter periplasmic adaptor subunit [Psychromonas sp. Urea-02u-13]
MFLSAVSYIVLRPYYLTLLITALLFFWMFSAPAQSELIEKDKETPVVALPKVQTTHFTPQAMIKELSLYGKSEANSRAVIRAEVAGKIIKISTQKGHYVKANKSLINIEKSELPERLAQAEAQLAERELNFKAVKSLNDRGLQGRARLAEMKSLYLVAKTSVKKLKLQLQRTHVVAPFAGVLQEQFADKGDYMQVGDPIFSIENTNPIVIRGDATEHYITQLKRGQKVTATLLSGDVISGKLTFIASMADSKSSTFRIEAEFDNPDFKIFSGISAKLTIPLYPVDAIYVSPSALAMDESGNLGVKLVKQGIVVFIAINLVEADNDGAWLSGFDGPVDIITLGQGFVKPGAQVDATAAKE